MKLSAGMIWTCQAATAKTNRAHAKIVSVLLHQDVRRYFRSTEKAVQGCIYGHHLRDASLVSVIRRNLPAGGELHQRQLVRKIAIDFICRCEDKNRVEYFGGKLRAN